MAKIDPLDLRVLDALADEGADLTKPTNFIFFAQFRDEDGAACAVARLSVEGWRCRVVASEEEGFTRTLFADRDEVPSPENVAQMRAEIELVAEECGGSYDDWEAAVTT